MKRRKVDAQASKSKLPTIIQEVESPAATTGKRPPDGPAEKSSTLATITAVVKLLALLAGLLLPIGHAIGYGRHLAFCQAFQINTDLFELTAQRYVLEAYAISADIALKIGITIATWPVMMRLLLYFVLVLAFVLTVLWLSSRPGKLSDLTISSRTKKIIGIGMLTIFGPVFTGLTVVLLVMLVSLYAIPLAIGIIAGEKEAKEIINRKETILVTRPQPANPTEWMCQGELLLASDQNRAWFDRKSQTVCVESKDNRPIAKWVLVKTP